MSLRRIFCSLLASVAICCVLFSVSAYAVGTEPYNLSGVILPMLPETDKQFWIIYLRSDGVIRAYNTAVQPAIKDYPDKVHLAYPSVYELEDGVWSNTGQSPGGISLEIESIIYDNTGTFASNSLAIFGVKEIIKFKDFEDVINAFTLQINVRSVIAVLIGLAGVSVGLVFMWWGVRKVSGSLMKAFKKGKIRI